MSEIEVLQELYEEQLGCYWHKLLDLRELITTNTGSELRLKSIKDRLEEKSRIENILNVLEKLSDEVLKIPNWYFMVLEKHNLKDERLNI